MSKLVLVSVTNDLYSDQRVDKVCNSLVTMGFRVKLLGRAYADSPILSPRLYTTKRFRLCFRKGPLFYTEYNIRLFFYLLFSKCDLLVSNDLDTLLPNTLVHLIRHKPIIYDSHEYFCGVPELINRKSVYQIWKSIERFCFPKLKDIFTVNQSIAGLYEKEYNCKLHIVRNVPIAGKIAFTKTRQDLGLPTNQKILIIQGAGINKDRGAETMVEAMIYLKNTILIFVGSGDVICLLQKMTHQLNLNDKVLFFPRMPYTDLMQYTYNADFGLILDKPTCINQRFSLPNKLFDFIHAQTPVIASNLPEIERIINTYCVGSILKNIPNSPKQLATEISQIISDEDSYKIYKNNMPKAQYELNWQTEEKYIQLVYKPYL